MSFLNQVIEATKESNMKFKLERAEYERASNVLYDIAERKLKKFVLQRAKDGFTDATFDVVGDLKLDIAGKWSIPELLFAIIFEDIPPVVSRLFYLANSPFAGFSISTKAPKENGTQTVFVLDWAYEMLQYKPQPTPPAKPQPTPPTKPQPTPPTKSQPAPHTSPAPEYDFTKELNDYLAAIGTGSVNFPHQTTPNTKTGAQVPPGAPVKPPNPVARNLFADSSIPMLTDQEIIDYITSLYGTPGTKLYHA